MTTEAVLNLAWAILCLGALACHFWRDGLGTGARGRLVRLRGALSVLVAAVALFPIVSASDDRLSLAGVLESASPQSVALERGQVHQTTPSAALEDPEHGQTPAPLFAFALAVALFAIAAPRTLSLIRGSVRRSLGRAPPSTPAYA